MKTKIAIGILVVIIIAGFIIYPKVVKEVPQDGVVAKEMRFDSLRDMRYAEVFLIGGNAITKNLSAAFYNSTDLNNEADSRNTCPQELWDKINIDEQKEKYDVLAVFKNGPRHWTMDWIKIPVGQELDFNGFKARWFGQVELPKHVDINKKGSTGYKPTEVARKSVMGFHAGTKVFALIDPQGRPWVMQAYGLIVDPSQTYEGLFTLKNKLKNMPSDWDYKVFDLKEELVIHADENGIAYIVQDELGNTYDLVDAKTSDYKLPF